MLASESTGTVPCPVTKLCPNHLRVKMSEPVHITCVRYNCFGELLATYNDEDIYLFSAAGSGGQQHPIASNTQGGHGHNEPKEEAEGGDGDEDCRATGAQASSSPHAGAGSRGGGGGGEGHCSTSCQQGGCQREDYVQQKFSGHRNSQTVKGVNFFGASDEYVISGSDCGHIFIWQKRDGELKKLLRGDAWVVNCLEPHPWQPLVLATSGIENTIKIWSPTSEGVQPLDQEKTKQVLDGNAAHRQRVARRAIIPPRMLLALLTGHR
uniref:Uncharacterized protein n=4 Tax=Dunaliella tertiolecta TaxID=3047 RepID=A0A7S3QS69_DUNTE